MIVLDKAYRKEPIPGLRSRITGRVRSRSLDMLQLKVPPFDRGMRDDIVSAFDQWDADRVYACCPFANTLDAYPGPNGGMNELHEYEKRLREKTDDDKEMNAWANNIITIIHRELAPPKSWRN
jgi:hypothetical protein